MKKPATVVLLLSLALSACQSPHTITMGESEARQRAAMEAEQAKLDTDCPDSMKTETRERCKTAEELIAEACESQNRISRNQGVILYEKEIGQKAGFVNAGKIYQATKDIDLDQFSIRENRKQLKKKYHQKLNLKACPKDQ